MAFFVKYWINGLIGENPDSLALEVGPFKNKDNAEDQMADIVGYMNIFGAHVIEKTDVDILDPAARAAEKQASRDKDALDLATGKVTVEELRKANGAFAFPNVKIKLKGEKF